ncbi:MAG: DsbA family protein [Corynebacterium sp.]|nr:DsbA family protein [Corynebacterium sp.]
MARQLKFWFDVSCPYCWITSRWIKEVEKVRDIEVQWVPMSLSVLNEGREELPEDYKRKMQANWGPARVCAAVATEHPDKLDALYTAFGEQLHPGGKGAREGYSAYNEVIIEVLDSLGLHEYAEIADTDTWDAALREYHQSAMDAVGDEVGTPVVRLGDVAFFGPVLTRIPRGEDAGRIFDAAFELAQYPHFYEIKRSRNERPAFD